MTVLVPTTELDAVNTILAEILEAPVNSLDSSGLNDVAEAKRELSRVCREVQSRGWSFNTLKDYTLAVEAVSPYNIYLPTNCLSFAPYGADEWRNLVMVGNRVYDGDNNTFAFTQAIKSKLVILRDFSLLPEAVRYYITVRAARIFLRKQLGDQVSVTFSADDERQAKATMLQDEARRKRLNVLTSNYAMAQTISDRPNY